MPHESSVYVAGAAARAAWERWNDALAERCSHELECWQARRGCDLAGAYCLIGRDLHEAEQWCHSVYRATVADMERAA